ncbi:hypothetical protein G9A89_021919 [Geosiphon pyriformis]|nr:hypothetical protein G9A89_021919 [Geosiphon pyriformis]
MELERRIQGPEEQKIHSFIKGLKTDFFYALWPLLALKNNSTIDMIIELAQRIEDNQRMHLESTLSVFAPVFSEKINNSKDPDLNPVLINPSNPLIKDNKIVVHLDCNNPSLPPSVPRNNDNQNNRIINNNVPNQRPNHANINFFGEDPLVEATDESASQPEENPFYAFNLTNDDHDMDELAINTSELTRKKKKAKIDFVIDSKKTSTLTADNNKPPKAKIDKPSIQPMTNIYGNKKKDLDIAKAIFVCINGISIETNIEVSEAKKYTIIVGNKWLKKAKMLLDYELCKLTIRCSEKPIVVKCCHWTTPLVSKQNQEKEQSDKSDDNKSNEEED